MSPDRRDKKTKEKQRVFKGLSQKITGCGSAWLERLIWDQEVAGSNPVTPTLRV